ncbi:MAG: bifunctional ADP-heptose synthase [Ignavibacteria bacterium]|jgi:rfaE bifunctional protein kinase chain/domain|nr:bifunctional ADP-heptose synthase [Ignavibacteria bacterium]
MDRKKVKKIFENASGRHICIIGDIMLDRYMMGNVSRISPEAPVQVFDLKSSNNKLGGAANVSLNIRTLGGNPYLIGVIGNDDTGKLLTREMKNLKIDTSGLIVDKKRPTTYKTRVISDSHHLIRIDSESKQDIDTETENRIFKKLESIAGNTGYIILQDYNKGVLTKSLIKRVIEFANRKKIRILVDPKFENFFEFRNTFIFKPNRKEIEDAFGRKAKGPEDFNKTVKELMKRLKCENVVLTLGEEGMRIYENSGGRLKIESIKTHARKVADVSGAGDTVISTIAFCLSGGASIYDAVFISNVAAGRVVEEVGIVPIHRNELLKKLEIDI